MDSQEKRSLLRQFPRAKAIGSKVLLPKLIDASGSPVPAIQSYATPDTCYTLTLASLHFLKSYDETQNLESSAIAAGKDLSWAKRFLAKHQAPGGYFWEKEKIKQLALVATPEWTKAKAVEGVTGHWKPKREQLECLKIVKDINYPKSILGSVQVNVLQMPTLSADAEKALIALSDREADRIETQAVSA